MSTTITPIFQMSKAFAKSVVNNNKGTSGAAATELKTALLGIQRKLGQQVRFADTVTVSASEELLSTNKALTEAKEALGRAKAEPQGLWNYWFGKPRDFSGLEAARDAAQANYDKAAENHAAEQASRATDREVQATKHARQAEHQTPGLKAMTVKYHGLPKEGREYIQVESNVTYGQKHATVKVNLPARGDTPAGQYAQEATEFAANFVKALDRRSPFISPRMATYGKDPKAALEHYDEAWKAFYAPVADAGGFSHADIAQRTLTKRGVQAKLMANGDFRIKLQNHPELGRLSYRAKQQTDQTIAQHIDQNMRLADRISRVLTFDDTEKAIRDSISTRFIRGNAVTKHVDLKRLAQMEAAKAELLSQRDRVHTLAQDNIFIKILRDGTFRITRKNNKGVVVQTETRSLPKFTRDKDDTEAQVQQKLREQMKTHIQKGLNKAEKLRDNLDETLFDKVEKRHGTQKAYAMRTDGSLLNKVSFTRNVRNKTHGVKKALVNLFG